MQKLIIVRGHSGSGKTTFAQQQIAQFELSYPQSKYFHIENDLFLMEGNNYVWSESRFQEAKLKARNALKSAFKFCQKHTALDCLIIVSNVGINRNEIYRMIKQAEKQHIQVEIYRLKTFYNNIHQVSDEVVKSMFNRLNELPIEGEMIIE
ncbi:AAA family ATPase [Pasteurella bettyae]|uniref:Uncharacterized protein n=1 Tax=Pasteurella bettyae CCUG 2042 TaxID=1095749 RepID=I3DI35_9PAST|nr:AAA family ATPase [Pasteurella bettyae]EIJ71378.1 hypothetical protein HMPREF1052_0140 [Pasteurella bettyae CCUG 2042]SUB21666.1 Uncharacterised protein [Pasteurella bettyae]